MSEDQQQMQNDAEFWENEAAQFCKNQQFYRGIVTEIGDLFGDHSKVSMDGSLQDDVLALQVPGLVRAALAELTEIVSYLNQDNEQTLVPNEHVRDAALLISFIKHSDVGEGLTEIKRLQSRWERNYEKSRSAL